MHCLACSESVASDGVAGATQGLVVAEALVPDAANHLGGKVADLALQGEAHVWGAGEAEFQQLGVVGGDLHAEVHVDCQLLRGERSAVQSLINDNRPSCSRATTGLPVQLWHKRDARSNGEDVAAVNADEVAQAGGSGMD